MIPKRSFCDEIMHMIHKSSICESWLFTVSAYVLYILKQFGQETESDYKHIVWNFLQNIAIFLNSTNVDS